MLIKDELDRYNWESPMGSGDYDGDDYLDSPMEDDRLQLFKSLTIQGQTMQFLTRTTSAEQDELIAEALGKAVRHSQRVCAREHIKADRVERVNHFMTSLRREIAYLETHIKKIPTDLRVWLQTVMCDKSHWYEIGIATSSGSMFNNWIQMANRKSSSANAQSEMILADLEELERSIAGIQQTVKDAERINNEGDIVVAQLCEVFQ